MSDKTIEEMNELRLNIEMVKELEYFKGNDNSVVNKAMKYMGAYIDNLRHEYNDRKVRIERKESMKKVLRVLYTFVLFNKRNASCVPSMRTIACILNPDLEPIKQEDSKKVAQQKEKAMHSEVMRVQRTVETLCEFGIIKTHEYRAGKNRNDDPDKVNYKNPNFYYELTPISVFCKTFKKKLKKACKKIQETTCQTYEKAVSKLGTLIENVKRQVDFQTIDFIVENSLKDLTKTLEQHIQEVIPMLPL